MVLVGNNPFDVEFFTKLLQKVFISPGFLITENASKLKSRKRY